MKNLTFDRDGCRDLRAALDPVLAKLGEELGATIKAGNASYDPTTNRITIKIEATAGDTERLTFNRLALGYGFEEADYGKPFTTTQGTFLLRGVTPSGCVLATDSHGKGVKWPVKATDSIVKRFHPGSQVVGREVRCDGEGVMPLRPIVRALVVPVLGLSVDRFGPVCAWCHTAPCAPSCNRPPVSKVVNINQATIDEVTLLPGVGPKLAVRVVMHRAYHGAFRRIEDLMQIKGIGEKFFYALRPYVVVAGPTTLTEKVKVRA